MFRLCSLSPARRSLHPLQKLEDLRLSEGRALAGEGHSQCTRIARSWRNSEGLGWLPPRLWTADADNVAALGPHAKEVKPRTAEGNSGAEKTKP